LFILIAAGVSVWTQGPARIASNKAVDEGRKHMSAAQNPNISSTGALQTGNYQKAIAEFSKAVTLDSTNDSAYLNRAIAYLAMPGTPVEESANRDLAIKDAEKVILIKPSSSIAYTLRGQAYLESAESVGLSSSMIEGFKKGLGIDTKTTLTDSRGNTADKTLDLAIADLTKSLSLYPGDYSTLYLRGKAYRLKNDHAAARADLEKAVSINASVGLAQQELKLLPAGSAKSSMPAQRHSSVEDAVGRWEATNVAGGYTVNFSVRIYKNGNELAGEIVNTAVGPPLPFNNFKVHSDRSYSFSVTARNNAVLTCTGYFNETFTDMTGDSTLNGGPQAFNGKWTAKKL
jgi:tetratricopeptide (TPR) repeat protein